MRLTPLLLLAPMALLAQRGGMAPQQGVRAPAARTATAAAPQFREEELCAVEGQVVNALTGDPVKKADVRLLAAQASAMGSSGGYSASADAAGRFAFRGVNPGRYRMVATRSGFATSYYVESGSTPAGSVVTLDPAKRLTGLVIRAIPNGAISGRILDENGDPAARVQVQLLRYQFLRGRRSLAPIGSTASTNDLGEFRVFDVAPGKYYLAATARQTRFDGLVSSDAQQEDYVPTYYPGVADASAAAPIEMTPGGQTPGIVLRLLRARTVRVRGRASQASVSIALVPASSARLSEVRRGARVDRQGDFEISGVVPGSYALLVTVPGNRGASYTARIPLEVGGSDMDGVAVNIPGPAQVSGKIRSEGDAAPALRNVRVTLAPRDETIAGPASSARVGEDGAFRMDSVSPDLYYISVSGLPQGYYIKSITAGGTDVRFAGLDLSGGSAAPLDILISPNAAQVSGSVQDDRAGRPAAGAIVTLIPVEKERRERDGFYRTAGADESGAFQFATVPPGEYRAFAWETMRDQSYMDPDFIKPFENRGQTVSVKEGDKATLQLKMIPADAVQ